MRRAAARDANEPAIVAALVRAGAYVLVCTHPDLIVGYRGKTFLIEVKNPDGRNRKTDSQRELEEQWNGGPLAFVRSPEEALDVITGHWQSG